jgi:ABC-type transport system involved in multi-copper enzyme maturation permease subunit
MAFRISLGPVFIYESLIMARRRQVYAGRALSVFAMLIGLTTAWYGAGGGSSPPVVTGGSGSTLQILAVAGKKFFYAMAAIQLTMVLLVAPAATAGAFGYDRARGIFAQLAATDLSNAEIVLGKLGSRLAPILAVLACGVPVTALAALLGGIDPQALCSLFAVSVALAVLGCTLALAISVHASKMHDVIIAIMALWIVWLVSLPVWEEMSTLNGVVAPPDLFKKANPFVLVYAPYVSPGYVAPSDVAIFVSALLVISTALIATTISTVRRGVLEPARLARRIAVLDMLSVSKWLAWLPGPSLDGNPVLWREWHRSRPSRLTRVVWAVYGIGTVAGIGIGIHEAIVHGPSTPSGLIVPSTVLLLQFVFGLVIVSSLAPTSLAEERGRGTLDVLMTTPLSTRSILWGKWLGTFRVVLWLALITGLTTLVLAFMASPVSRSRVAGSLGADSMALSLVDRAAAPCVVASQMLTYGAAITSLGLVLATWVSRIGRAIAVNVVIFVLIAIGWPLFFEAVIWYPLREWLATEWNIGGAAERWLVSSMMAISPFAAPIVTIECLSDFDSTTRWKVWHVALVWCLLAWWFAAAMYWAALKTFDRCQGRVPDASDFD